MLHLGFHLLGLLLVDLHSFAKIDESVSCRGVLHRKALHVLFPVLLEDYFLSDYCLLSNSEGIRSFLVWSNWRRCLPRVSKIFSFLQIICLYNCGVGSHFQCRFRHHYRGFCRLHLFCRRWLDDSRDDLLLLIPHHIVDRANRFQTFVDVLSVPSFPFIVGDCQLGNDQIN